MAPKHRCKVLLDEMMPRGNKFPLTNHYHDLKQIVHDYKHLGWTDQEVMGLAKQQGRIVVTKNIKHFLPLAKQLQIDLICITETMAPEILDTILLSKLNNWPSSSSKGRVVKISKPKRKLQT